ncbi:pheophorbide a oxygenase, chloroplastic [Lycium barbarum]|uniref:pheophorbide a oxygenase, chloroplastic n=1 Tax=Lycium barbarum TaxID=112863 RepID=UPI00293F0A98|nr:pheophorbide a oxygenase, chloroplastic [Lycium barbarum]
MASSSSLLLVSPPPTPQILSLSSLPSLHTKTQNFLGFKRTKKRLSPLKVVAPQTTTTPSTNDQDSKSSDLHEVNTQDDEQDSSSKFSWRDNWYPVSLIEDLDPSLPTPFQLLNRDLVLWFDKSNSQWVAFDDKCPHRLAPLSEGRIDENGDLQCSYHGWSFDGCGSCTRIPQAASEGPEAKAFQSPRACATRFPTMVSQGLLFIWPDENGWERAQATKPPMLPEEFDKPEFATVTIQRDLFYGYDTLMENVSDPSHIDFAHHKVTGRRDRAKPLPFKMEASGPWGFAGANNDKPKISAKFVAPCYSMNKIEIDTKLPIVGDQKWVIWICSFNVPMAPGKTRSIVCSARNFFQFTVPGPAWWQVFPRWQEHWTSNLVYDGDMIVLQGQEKIFLSKSKDGTDVNKEYTKLTFTPTQADRFVLAFRNWLRRHGNSEPEWFGSTDNQPLPSTVLSKRQMMDRFEQHTLKCSSCRNAYYTFEKLQKFLIGAVVVCCATSGIPADANLRIILGSIAILSAGLAYILHELQKNFVFVDYVHAEID